MVLPKLRLLSRVFCYSAKSMVGSNIPGLPLYQKKVCTSIYNKYCITTLTTSSLTSVLTYILDFLPFVQCLYLTLLKMSRNWKDQELSKLIYLMICFQNKSVRKVQRYTIFIIMFEVMITLNKFTFF